MYEVFKIKSSKPTPKNFRKTSLILKNPKFSKKKPPKNIGYKAWKWEIRNLPSEEKLE